MKMMVKMLAKTLFEINQARIWRSTIDTVEVKKGLRGARRNIERVKFICQRHQEGIFFVDEHLQGMCSALGTTHHNYGLPKLEARLLAMRVKQVEWFTVGDFGNIFK